MATTPENEGDQPSFKLSSRELQEIKSKGRWLRRVCQPFHAFEAILSVGMDSQEGAQHLIDPSTREYIDDLSPTVRELRARDAKMITNHLPIIAARLTSPTATPEEVTEIANLVQRKADEGRETDTRNLKAHILQMVPEEYLPDVDVPGVRKVASAYVPFKNPEATKYWRGFNNIVTTRLLCPARYHGKYKDDPERTQRELGNRTLLLKDREGDPLLPLFLYDEKVMDQSTTKGLFRGPLLLKAYRYIFLGPAHTDGITTGKKKKGNAEKHNMKTVEPSTICYTAIQVHVALSCMEEWSVSDEEVDLSLMYDLLREQFQDPDDPWVKETLGWWNERVFPKPTDTGDDARELRDMNGPSTRELIQMERRARGARGMAPATGA